MTKGTQRRLAAIVSADVASYPRLLGANETGTLAAGVKGIRMSMEEDKGEQTRSALDAYFCGFNAKDISLMPIGDDVYFKAPVNPEPVVGLQ